MNTLQKLRQQKLLSAALLVFTLSIGILIGTLINTAVLAEKGQAPAPDATPLVIPSPAQLSTAFSQLAKQLEPSVVNITSTYGAREQEQAQRRQRPGPQEGEEDPYGMDFFRRFFGSPFGDFPQRPFRRSSAGSGFIVDKNGYILTNLHVVDEADRIRVKLNDDTKDYDAKLIGSDPELDVAVIKIDVGRALAAAKIGNSDGTQVGDWVIAIGSPFGLEATVTVGIISAKGRDVSDPQHQLQKFLQTDAAINPGNSGGPLLNLKGEVIGINTAIATETGTYNGVGFALPVNMAVNAYNQIIKTGRVTRGGIGVQFPRERNRNLELLRAYGATQGVFVDSVSPDGPAAKAGIRSEDILVSINGRPVKDGEDLVNRVSATPVGDVLSVSVLRNGKKLDFQVTVGERAEIFAEALGGRRGQPESTRSETTEAMFGFWYRTLRQGERERLGYEDRDGVLVTRVDPNSFAEDIGMARNDIITAINRQAVTSAEDVKRLQATLKAGQPIAFRIMRPAPTRTGRVNWQPLFLAGTLPDKP